MIQCTANLSDGLVYLIQSEAIQINAVEVGPWFSVKQIIQYQQLLPGWKFYFHHNNLIFNLKWVPGATNSLRTYIQCTKSPWLSFHYSLLPPGYARFATKYGRYLPLPKSSHSAKWFVDEVFKLKRVVQLPLLLENMPSFPTNKYALEILAENICEILALTDTAFLLDIAHARVVASVFGLDVCKYISRLPLEKVAQIHISGPRDRNGYLFDAHEDLCEEDYSLLEWVLARTNPQVVTLEYFKDRERLREQLTRIQEIIVTT